MEQMLLSESRINNEVGIINSEKISQTNLVKYFENETESELQQKNSPNFNLMADIELLSQKKILTFDLLEEGILKLKPVNKNSELIKVENVNYFQINDAVFSRVSKFNTISINFPQEESNENEPNDKVDVISVKNKIEKKKNIYKFSPFLSKSDHANFVFLCVFYKYFTQGSFSSTEAFEDKDFIDFQKKTDKINEPLLKDIKNLEKECLELENPTLSNLSDSFIKYLLRPIGEKHNSHNSYIFQFIKTLHMYPLQKERLYYNWKQNFGKLVTLWDFKKSFRLENKLNIKYLKVKFLLLKLFRIKEKERLFTYFPKEEEAKSFLSLGKFNNEGDSYPRVSFLVDSYSTVFLDFAVDATILFQIFMLPINYVLNVNSSNLSMVEQICNILYFVDCLRRFRTLSQDEMKNQDNNLKKPFDMNIGSFSFILDLISLLPLEVFFSRGNPDIKNTGVIFCKFLVLLRFARFGRSFLFLNTTKYAVVFRLLKLMGQFVFFIHWLGLYLLIYFKDELYSGNLEPSCDTNNPITQYTKYCLYVEALYSGSFVVPGKTLLAWGYFDQFRTTTQYFFLFIVFLVGQINTATVFGSVSELISNLNQAENKFQEINDNHRITGFYYKFDKEMFDEVQLYYEYIWLKHREKIFGMEIFDNLSPILMRRYLKELISDSYLYLLKDFIILKKRKNKFMTFIINNITKQITSPYERIVTQGEVIKGLYILSNGNIFFEDEKTKRKDLSGEIKIYQKLIGEKLTYIADKLYDKYVDDKICFPLDSLFLKTGRALQTYYSKYFADFYFLPIEVFDNQLIDKYPAEMMELSIKAKKEGLAKLGKDFNLFKLISNYSSRSTGKYYEPEFNDLNIWIEIKQSFPKLKLKTNTLTNRLDVLESLNYSNGLFEISYTSCRYLVFQLKS